jgi:hypothetical protein
VNFEYEEKKESKKKKKTTQQQSVQKNQTRIAVRERGCREELNDTTEDNFSLPQDTAHIV